MAFTKKASPFQNPFNVTALIKIPADQVKEHQDDRYREQRADKIVNFLANSCHDTERFFANQRNQGYPAKQQDQPRDPQHDKDDCKEPVNEARRCVVTLYLNTSLTVLKFLWAGDHIYQPEQQDYEEQPIPGFGDQFVHTN